MVKLRIGEGEQLVGRSDKIRALKLPLVSVKAIIVTEGGTHRKGHVGSGLSGLALGRNENPGLAGGFRPAQTETDQIRQVGRRVGTSTDIEYVEQRRTPRLDDELRPTQRRFVPG